MRNVTEIQQRLIALGFLAPLDEQGRPNDDGKFGGRSLDAFNHFRASKGKPPIIPKVSMEQLNADLFPEEQPPPSPPRSNPLSNLGTLLSLVQLLKGKTMTSDQLTGLVRALLAALAAYAAGKGWIPGVSPELLATLATAIVGVWSWISNRPKVISPIGK